MLLSGEAHYDYDGTRNLTFERRGIETERMPKIQGAIDFMERWISEALALEAAGMPSASFSLIFENDGGSDQYFEVFEGLRLDAIFMLATDKLLIEKPIVFPSTSSPSKRPFYTFDRWPEAVQAIADGKSIVRCDFPLRPDLPTVDQALQSKPFQVEINLDRPGQCLRRQNRRSWLWVYIMIRDGYQRNEIPRNLLKMPPAFQKSWEELQLENAIPEYFDSGEHEGAFLDTDSESSESSDSSPAGSRPSSPSA